MFLDSNDDCNEPLILHCFADYGAESEALSQYGNVVRVGIDTIDTNNSEPITADAHILGEGKNWNIPFKEDLIFDLGVFHPVCSKWASTTSISGDPGDHTNMIPSARSIAERYCKHYMIENVPRAPLKDPIVLDGRMFGLPIMYERAFENSSANQTVGRYDSGNLTSSRETEETAASKAPGRSTPAACCAPRLAHSVRSAAVLTSPGFAERPAPFSPTPWRLFGRQMPNSAVVIDTYY